MKRAVACLIAASCIGAVSARCEAGASTHYVAETAQGAGDGSSPADARGVSWFNTASNWGTGADQIGPGDTVFLSGVITSDLTFQGSGATGAYITVDGGGATLSCTVIESNRSWWRVRNCTWSDGYPRELMSVRGGSHGAFTGNYADDVSGGSSVWLGQNSGLCHDITIADNFIRTSAANFGDVQVDIIKTEGSYNIVLEGNHLEMRIAGQSPYNQSHDDVIQTYEKGGASSGNPRDWTIRHNRIVMNSSTDAHRSWGMLEALSGTNRIYGNVFLGIQGAGGANGLNINSSRSGVVFHIYNNTFVAKPGASNNTISLKNDGTAYLRNNIVHTSGQTALYGDMTIVRDHNLWCGTNIPSIGGHDGSLANQDPLFADYTGNDFALQAGSPAIGAGIDLGGPYGSHVVAGTSWPDPALGSRPSVAAWAMGAYEYGTADDPVNDAPEIDSSLPLDDPVTVAAGATETFSVWCSDADGDGLSYAWTIDSSPTPGAAADFEYSPAAADAGGHTIEVSVTDGRGGAASHTWDVTVSTTSVPPPVPPDGDGIDGVSSGGGLGETGISCASSGVSAGPAGLVLFWTVLAAAGWTARMRRSSSVASL